MCAGPETFTLQKDKLVEAVIYLAERSADDPNFGLTKLTKLLYFADAAAYRKHGVPITGATYLHFPHGPYPANWHQLRREMQAAGDVRVDYDQSQGGSHRYWLRPNRAARLEALSAADCAILDEQLDQFAHCNDAGIIEHSQYGLGWLATEDGEPISYAMSGWAAPPADARTAEKRRQAANDLPGR